MATREHLDIQAHFRRVWEEEVVRGLQSRYKDRSKIHVSDLVRCPGFTAANTAKQFADLDAYLDDGTIPPIPYPGATLEDKELLYGRWRMFRGTIIHEGLEWVYRKYGVDKIRWETEVFCDSEHHYPGLNIIGSVDLVFYGNEELVPVLMDIKTGLTWPTKSFDPAHGMQVNIYAQLLDIQADLYVLNVKHGTKRKGMYTNSVQHLPVFVPVERKEVDLEGRVERYNKVCRDLEEGLSPTYKEPRGDWQCRAPYCKNVYCEKRVVR